MYYSATCMWEKGSRQVNEDSLALVSLKINSTPALLAIVADGVGGLQKGEDASSYLVSSLREAFLAYARAGRPFSTKHISRLLLRELYRCHRRLLIHGRQESITLATTCSIAYIQGRHLITLHIGDSRIYHNSRQITTSHSINRTLTRAIGAGHYHIPDYNHLTVKSGDTVTVCSDGYYLSQSTDNKSAVTIHIKED